MKTKYILAALGFALGVAIAVPAGAQDKLDRTVLPLAEPDPPHSTVLDARDANAAAAL